MDQGNAILLNPMFTSYCYALHINSMGETRTIKIDGKTGQTLSDVKTFAEE